MLRRRLAAKRPRLPAMSTPSTEHLSDDSSTSASSSTSSFTPLAGRDVTGAADSIREELRRTALELEPVVGKEPTQVLGYRPTYRGVLARKGYLVRNTLGSGSYSKVCVKGNI